MQPHCSTNESTKLKNLFKDFKKTPSNELFIIVVENARQIINEPVSVTSKIGSFGMNAETVFKYNYTDTEDIVISKFKELLVGIDSLKKNDYRLAENERIQFLEWLNDYDECIRAIYKFPILIRVINKERCDEIVQRVQKYHDKFMEKTRLLKTECDKLERDITITHSHWVGIYNQYQADQYCTSMNDLYGGASGIRNFECNLRNLQNTIKNQLEYQTRLLEKILKYQNKMSGFHSATVSPHWPRDILMNEVENIRAHFEENVIEKYENLYTQYEENLAKLVKLHDDIVRWLEINT